MAYDSRCYDLAETFLEEEKNVTEEDKEDLAQTIQTAIEDWLGYREHHLNDKPKPLHEANPKQR